MRSRTCRSLLPIALATVAVLIAAVPLALAAQDRPARPITTPATEFAEPFSAVSLIVELADGRVLVHDARERRLGIVDFRRGEFRVTAREGAGPLEYGMLASIVRMPGDSAGAWDLRNSRRLSFAPDGSPAGTSAVTGPGGAMMRFGQPIPEMSDARGRWYALFQGMTMGGGAMQVADSFALVRVSPATGAQDTIVSLPVPRSHPTERADGKIRVRASGFVARDAWGVFPDGSVLVVRGAAYVPEIVRPDGRRVVAPAVPFARIPVTAADRAAHLKELEGRMSRMGAMLNAELRGGAAAGVEVLPPEPWQEHHPPLLGTRIPVDSRGRAWVQVMDRDRAAGERHDLLDGDGRLVDTVRLPKGERLVAMGRGVIYTTREDADGLVYLRRYALP
jgi:hypothetical protein